MLTFMERSTMYYLHQKGWSKTEIAEFVGHHRDTIARVLREPVDKPPAPRQRTSAVAVFDAQIQNWLDQRRTVQRMLEEARQHPDYPDTGSASACYDDVRPIKRARTATPSQVPVRFDGLPGELLQIDWGEVRQFPFPQPALAGQTRSFFAARLTYSRWMWVRFTTDMREETLLRCLIAVFAALDGVPWVVTTDTMKTVTLGRDTDHQPIRHPAFAKCAAEFGVHPDACTPRAGNQKGAVESLVTFVKQNVLLGRTFHDDTDLAQACTAWLQQVNTQRPSDATDCLPSSLLVDEQAQFGPLPPVAHDYGFFDTVTVSRERLVAIATNRSSVPVHLVGIVLTARIHPQRIALYHGDTLVATHSRHMVYCFPGSAPEHVPTAWPHICTTRLRMTVPAHCGILSVMGSFVCSPKGGHQWMLRCRPIASPSASSCRTTPTGVPAPWRMPSAAQSVGSKNGAPAWAPPIPMMPPSSSVTPMPPTPGRFRGGQHICFPFIKPHQAAFRRCSRRPTRSFS